MCITPIGILSYLPKFPSEKKNQPGCMQKVPKGKLISVTNNANITRTDSNKRKLKPSTTPITTQKIPADPNCNKERR